MDIFDQATVVVERDRERSLAAVRGQVDKTPPCGSCYNCGDPVADPLRFCDKDCRDDFQKRERAGR